MRALICAAAVLLTASPALAGYKACEENVDCTDFEEKCIEAPGGGMACAEIIYGEPCTSDPDCRGIGAEDCEKDSSDVNTFCISYGAFVDGPDPGPSAQVCQSDSDCSSGVCDADGTCKGGGGCSTTGGAGQWPAGLLLAGLLLFVRRRR